MRESEDKNINLEDFQKIGKNGNPYDILDDKISEYITQEQLDMFVLNGQPYLYRHGVYKRDEDGKILKAHIKALIFPDLITINRINRVYNLILSDYRLLRKNDEVNQYPTYWINFQNGMYDLVLQELHPHDPKYMAINQIPHEYVPNAEYRGTIADQFLRGIIPDESDREMILAYAGYCMTTDTSMQKFLVLLGLSGAGKSTVINLITDMVGAENVSCISLQDLGERFMPTELLGKLLNACAELPKKALEQTDAIKRITGEDLVKGEYKGGKVFMFRSYAKLLFSANEMPVTLDEKSGAFFRRMLVIDVKNKGEYIPNLARGLKESMPGFINACVAALSRHYLTGKEIDSQNSRESVHELFRESDSVLAFLDDCMEKIPGERTDRVLLYERYKAYCWSNEWPALGCRNFYKNLRSKGYQESTIQGRRYFRDISLRTCIEVHQDAGKCTQVQENCTQVQKKGAVFEPATPEESAVFAEKTG